MLSSATITSPARSWDVTSTMVAIHLGSHTLLAIFAAMLPDVEADTMQK